VEAVIAWLLAVLTLGSCFPGPPLQPATTSNSWAVGVLNFLIGWTFIGWIAAVVLNLHAPRW